MRAKIRGNTFWASGDTNTMNVHEKLVSYHNKMEMIRTVAAYGASVGFAAIGALLIAFAPESRSTAADIVAAALLVSALGLAGFTRFRAQLPGMKIEGDSK